MDSIWSTRRYVPVTVDIDHLTMNCKQILKAASSKTLRAKPAQNPNLHQQQQQLQKNRSHLQIQIDPVESELLKGTDVGPVPHIAPVSTGWPRRKPLDVVFSDVCLTIGKKTILSRISGACRPGEVLAVMGPSGSGKTSLLNVISGRLRPTSGSISVNGVPLSKRHKRQICYVLQQDIFYTDITLRQTLVYTALLRLPDSMTYQEKMNHVDNIIEILDLKRCQDTNIGSIMDRGLSGGEKKRTSIACELLTNPSIMLLDEPTSGLDSSTAHSIMTTLKRFAEKENKTVIVTLHQPSSQIFYMVDRLLLLCNGQNAYFGNTKKVVEHFASIGLPIAPHYNPADFILEQVKGPKEVQEKLIQSAKEGVQMSFNLQQTVTLPTSPSIHSFYSKYLTLPSVPVSSDVETNDNLWDGDCTNFKEYTCYHPNCPTDISVTINVSKKESPAYNKIVGEEEDSGRSSWSEETESETSASSSSYESFNDPQWPTSFFTQFKVLTQRNFCVAKPLLLSRLNWIQTLALGLLAGLLWYQVPREEENLQDIQGWMFFSSSYWTMFFLFTALQSFPTEKEVITKERASGSYRVSAYYLAKMVGELPLTVILPTFYFLISYPMMGFHSFMTALQLLLMLLLGTLVGQSYGFFIGAICGNLPRGITISAIFTFFTQLFGGYLNNRIPEWMDWARYLSIVHYIFQNMNFIEFSSGEGLRCAKGISSFSSCRANSSSVVESDTGNFIDVEEILKARGQTLPLWGNTAILLGYMIVTRFLTYLVLRYLHRPK
ncbi:uncharacterized protein LOC135205559 [Macrobrachium nipponense]|uniref:uncharacterized protein LOC135205559 n=1 Tax=Macrobrachium nipponense TaxID=159736 RepID=UPI0030C8AA4E